MYNSIYFRYLDCTSGFNKYCRISIAVDGWLTIGPSNAEMTVCHERSAGTASTQLSMTLIILTVLLSQP